MTLTVPPKDAAQRLIDRMRRAFDDDKDRPRDLRRSQSELAERLGITKSTVSQALRRRDNTAFRLIQLDIIADYLGIPPSELIARPDSQLLELRRDEQRLIRQWRQWPSDVRARLLSVFEFFGETIWPEELEKKRWLHDLQRLPPEKRATLRQTLDALLVATRAGRVPAQREQPEKTWTFGASAPRTPTTQKTK